MVAKTAVLYCLQLFVRFYCLDREKNPVFTRPLLCNSCIVHENRAKQKLILGLHICKGGLHCFFNISSYFSQFLLLHIHFILNFFSTDISVNVELL